MTSPPSPPPIIRKALPSPDHPGKAVAKIDDLIPLLDVGDLTRILKCSRAVIYGMSRRGEIPSVLVAEKLVRFERQAVEEYIVKRRGKNHPTGPKRQPQKGRRGR